jgi:hypothetical protein
MQEDMNSLFGGGPSSGCDSPLGCDDPNGTAGQPHVVKIRFGSPFGLGNPFAGNPFSSFSSMSTSSSDSDAALGEPSSGPHIKIIKLGDIGDLFGGAGGI